jgi:hypothetical protein
MGVSAARMGDKSMSCGELVRLPSSTVLTIPKGMPVMIGGPPAISIHGCDRSAGTVEVGRGLHARSAEPHEGIASL